MGDAVSRPLPDTVTDPTTHEPFGTAWADYEAATAEELRAALRLDERQRWAEELSGGIVQYPSEVERPWVRAVDEGGPQAH